MVLLSFPGCWWCYVATRTGLGMLSPNDPMYQRLEAIKAALDTLPPQEQLVLRYRYGLMDDSRHREHEEIAALLGLSLQACKDIEARAVQLLSAAV